MNKLVSVIIPTYNRPDMLDRAINSVLAQKYECFEILVIDDNNSESEFRRSTEIMMERYANNHKVRYIKHEFNKGGCAARNTGIKNSKGEFIAFLDDDDEWDNHFIDKLITCFYSDEIGAVYCNRYIGKNGKIYNYSKYKTPMYSGPVFEKLLGGWCPDSTSMFIVRKYCFEKVGGFDENLKSFQDYDMWLRIARVFSFNYVEENLVLKHEGHGGEQVGFNPYNRRKAMDMLIEKWSNSLSNKEKILFSNFLEQHLNVIKYNLIIYNKQRKIKCNYFKLYKDYFVTKTRMVDKITLLLVCIFGISILELKDMIASKLLRRIEVIGSN
jgi:glycosyltransferase involved in cell wall biosynthesis